MEEDSENNRFDVFIRATDGQSQPPSDRATITAGIRGMEDQDVRFDLPLVCISPR